MILSSSQGIFQYCEAAKNRTKFQEGTSLQSLFWRSTNSRMVDPAWKAHPPSNYPMLGPTPPQGRAGSRHLFAAHCGIFCSWERGPSAIRRAAQGPGLGALACRHLHAALRTTSCTVLGGSALVVLPKWQCPDLLK